MALTIAVFNMLIAEATKAPGVVVHVGYQCGGRTRATATAWR